MFSNDKVRRTAELERVLALPIRSLEDTPPNLAERLTELLKKPGGTQKLRKLQALACWEMHRMGGAFCAVETGGGKTLTSFLAAHILKAKKALLILPASLIEKTENERKEYEKHWQFPSVQMVSYESLGRHNFAAFLAEGQFDLLILDEVHRVKRRSAAVTRRISRYMHDNPKTKMVALSGTIMKKSLLDFGHILHWTLKENAPVPRGFNELEEWAMALDERVDEFSRIDPGALFLFCAANDNDGTVEAARRGFRQRLINTPGVIATFGDAEEVDASICIRALKYELPQQTDDYFYKLRRRMLTPDDWPLTEAVDVWRHSKELALGLHYRWVPRPPEEWRTARREWAAFVRETLSRSRTIDSELQVVQACDIGRLPDAALKAWRHERDKPREDGKPFKPNVQPMWHDDAAINVCIKWMREAPGIVWVEHTLFAQRLAEASGCKYYGAKGLAADGEFIDHADPSKSAIVSIDANKEGRNLQKKWHRNLITSLPEGPDVNQQLMSRTHRPGQTAPVVYFDILLGCREHANAFKRARAGAQAVKDTTGADSKLLIAKVEWPSDEEIDSYVGARWGRDQGTQQDEAA